MSRRYDQPELSTAKVQLRVTPTVYDRIRGLAWYYREGYAQLLRRLADARRRALHEQNLRPPPKAPDNCDWLSLRAEAVVSEREANEGSERATQRLILTVTPTEKDRIEGLAWYSRSTVAELLRQLAEEDRKRLYNEGKRPPVRPPEGGTLMVADSRGPKTPRK